MTESSPAPNGEVASAGAGASAAPAPEEKWGQVVLTISNSVMPLEKLSPTPSSLDGMTQAVEDDLRNLGCDLIQTAGEPLKLQKGLILLHLFNHATHHRGQCHHMLTQLGADAPILDLPFYLLDL